MNAKPRLAIAEIDRRWTVLAAMCLATAVTEFDETVMSVALPSIDASFGSSLGLIEWTVTAYVLAFAAFLVPAGRLADALGPRRLFLAGAGLFAVASVGSALAPTVATLIAARAVQGVGAALLTPASFAVVVRAFDERARGTALGLWTAIVAVGAAVGPLGGGVLIELFGWRAIFVMGIPIMLVSIAITIAAVPADGPQRGAPPRALSVALLAVSLALLLVGLARAGGAGFVPGGVSLIGCGLGGLAALAVYDARDCKPLLRLRLLQLRSYLAVNTAMLIAAAVWLMMLLLQGIYLRSVLALSPLAAGLALMPLTLAAVISAPLSGSSVRRIGARKLIVAGMALIACSLLLLATIDQSTGYWPRLLVAYTLNGVGWGMLQTPIETSAVSSVGEQDAGFASGFVGMVYQLGAALGIAAASAGLQALGSARLERLLNAQGIPASAAQRAALARSQLDGNAGIEKILQLLPGLPGSTASRVADALRASFIHALTTTMGLAAALAGLGALLAGWLMRSARDRPTREKESSRCP